VAQTGTGKTCAFGVPILQHILAARAANQTSSSSSSSSSSTVIAAEQTFTKNVVRALIVTPTRELAMQIEENMRSYAVHCGVSTVVLFGGVKQAKQEAQLNKGCEVVVATPGRLLDLIGQDLLSLSHVKHFVLDEADQMLDMGFIKDVSRIVALLPTARQSLFFSATMPEPVVKLARKILINNPRKVVIRPQQQTAERVEQQVYHVEGKLKVKLLVHIIKTIPKSANMLVFVRTKRGADIVAKLLNKVRLHVFSVTMYRNKRVRL
jgi:ATP-dependent RNA helicase RhlE